MLLRYLLDFQFGLVSFNDTTWNLLIPFAIPCIPIFTGFRIRSRVLKWKRDQEKGLTFFQFVAWGMMAAMLMTSQLLVESLNAHLVRVETIDQLEGNSKFTHVRFGKIAVDTSAVSFTSDIYSSGKHNQDLNFRLYFVLPILRDALIGVEPDSVYKAAVLFHKTVDNRHSEEQNKKDYERFLNKSWAEIESYDFDNADHFQRVPPSEKLTGFRRAASRADPEVEAERLIFLQPVHHPYTTQVSRRLLWLFGWLLASITILSLFLALTGFRRSEYRRQLRGDKPWKGEVDILLNYFIPRDDHVVSSLLMDVLILVFIMMLISAGSFSAPRTSELMRWGALRRPEVLSGQWWRLFTSIFLHGGFVHLVSNVIGLMIAGVVLEPMVGRRNFLVLFLFSGLCGGLLSIGWHEQTASVGASGAVFGLFGALIMLALTRRFEAGVNKFVLTFGGIFVGINLLVGLTGGIDNAAHLGGLAGGSLAVLIFSRPVVMS